MSNKLERELIKIEREDYHIMKRERQIYVQGFSDSNIGPLRFINNFYQENKHKYTFIFNKADINERIEGCKQGIKHNEKQKKKTEDERKILESSIFILKQLEDTKILD